MNIPVFTPTITEDDVTAVADSVRSGHVSGTDAPFVAKFEKAFSHYCRRPYGVATSSGSTALHLAARVLDIGPGDEVLISALTNIATANAVATLGARVIPVDSEPITWNLDPHLLPSLITNRTRAIFPVHIYGHPYNVIAVRDFAHANRLHIVEDAAEAHGATYDNRPVGSFSSMACFSYYANKVITSGEGGMIVTDNIDYANRARSLRNLAFTTPRFLHRDIGYNYRMTNMQGALALSQFSRIDSIIKRKRQIAATYTSLLQSLAQQFIQLPFEMPLYKNIYWMYCILVSSSRHSRDALAAYLHKHGIETRTMFCPLNLQPALISRNLVDTAPCPVAENLWRTGLYLPSSLSLTVTQLEYIARNIHDYFESVA